MTKIGLTQEAFAVGDDPALLEPRVVWLSVFTARAGYALAPVSLPPVPTAAEGL